jgi:hypothetical protein
MTVRNFLNERQLVAIVHSKAARPLTAHPGWADHIPDRRETKIYDRTSVFLAGSYM